MEYMSFFRSTAGTGLVVATEVGICRLDLPPTGALYHDDAANSSALTREAADLLERYFKGERISFASFPLDLTGLTPFRQDVLHLAAQIPYGQLVSYAMLAKQCGRPGAARAVGGAMAANPIPIIVPCHRVVAASGDLTGYSGPGGVLMKKHLLRLEGVEFRGKRAALKIDCFTQEPLIQK